VAGFAVDNVFQNPPTNVESRKAVANAMVKTGEGTMELQSHPATVCGFGRAGPVPCAFVTLALAAPASLCLSCLGSPRRLCAGKRLVPGSNGAGRDSGTPEPPCYCLRFWLR
jgi:hypothetical protein